MKVSQTAWLQLRRDRTSPSGMGTGQLQPSATGQIRICSPPRRQTSEIVGQPVQMRQIHKRDARHRLQVPAATAHGPPYFSTIDRNDCRRSRARSCAQAPKRCKPNLACNPHELRGRRPALGPEALLPPTIIDDSGRKARGALASHSLISRNSVGRRCPSANRSTLSWSQSAPGPVVTLPHGILCTKCNWLGHGAGRRRTHS